MMVAGSPVGPALVLPGSRKPQLAEAAYWALDPADKLGMLATLCYNVLNTHIMRWAWLASGALPAEPWEADPVLTKQRPGFYSWRWWQMSKSQRKQAVRHGKAQNKLRCAACRDEIESTWESAAAQAKEARAAQVCPLSARHDQPAVSLVLDAVSVNQQQGMGLRRHMQGAMYQIQGLQDFVNPHS